VLAIALLGATLAVSLFYTPVPFILLVGVPIGIYLSARPYRLLLAMVFLIPFNFVFTVGPIPVAAELLKLFAWGPFLLCLGDEGNSFRTTRYNKCFAILVVLIVLSIFRSHDLNFTIGQSIRLVSNIGLCYLVVNLVDSREKVAQVFRVLTLSTLVVVCYGFYQFTIHDYGALFWIVNPRLDTSFAHGRDTFWPWRDRMISVLTSEMELGHYFNLCLPIGIALWFTEGRRRLTSKWLLISGAMLLGLLLTFTFGAWLSLAFTSCLFVLLANKRGRWKIILGGVLVLSMFVGVLTFGPLRPFIEEKILGSGIGSLAWDAFTRLESWVFAWKTFLSHPLIGVGYGGFPSLTVGNLTFLTEDWVSSGSSPHDIYLYLLSELGILGLGSLIFVLVGNIRSNLSLKANPEFGQFALAMAFALTTALVGGSSDDSPLYGPHTSYLLWLIVGMSGAVYNLARANENMGTA
jgi:O-antigen ligase